MNTVRTQKIKTLVVATLTVALMTSTGSRADDNTNPSVKVAPITFAYIDLSDIFCPVLPQCKRR